ncbi:MAG: hypothetical protein WCW61_02700 [Patescibacteria group bacterium]|jgi:hypothetical protein
MNNQYIQNIFEFNNVRGVAMYCFLLLMLFSIIPLLFFKKSDKQERFARLTGGSMVFIFAIISNNSYTIFASLFIGGLVIASEDFMKKLAIIFRSESKDIAENLKQITQDATSEELATEKIVEEKIIKNEMAPGTNNNIHSNHDFKAIREKNTQIENKVFVYLEKVYGDLFRKGVKISNEYGHIILDGVIYKKSNQEEISRIVEIKYISNFSENVRFQVDFMTRRVLEKMRYIFINKPLLFIVVSENIDRAVAQRVIEKNKKQNIVFKFYKLSGDVLEEYTFSHLFPSNL